MNEVTTAELVKALRCCTSPEACARCAYHECEEECENEVRRDAADRLEQQAQRIAELEAENCEIRQTHVSHATHAEFVSDYQEQIDEKDAKIAELEQAIADEKITSLSLRTAANSLKMQYEQSQRELAAAKEDLHCFDACQICVGNISHIDGCECDCLTCTLDCRCKDCRGENKWEWRGAKIVR